MDAVKVLIADLENAIRNGSADRRDDIATRITVLFAALAERLGEEQVELFDNVLGRVIRKIDGSAAAEISRRLARIGNAPLDIVRHFARHEDISIAGPMLAQSTRLTDRELIEIVSLRTQEPVQTAHLLAIASRPDISAAVTDVLLGCRDADVFRTLAENAGARFSDNGFAGLLKCAEADPKLAEAIGLRPDLACLHFQDLLARTTEAVWSRLLAAAPPQNRRRAGAILAILTEERVHMPGLPGDRDFAQAHTRALVMLSKGKLNEAAILEFAKAGRIADMLAALAMLCGAPLHMIRNLLRSEYPEALLVPCKTAGLGWPTARLVLAIGAAGRTMSDADLELARVDYIKSPLETAQRILRFWQGRHGAPHESAA